MEHALSQGPSARFLAAKAALVKAKARRGFVAAIAAALCMAMGQQQPARAAADFCQIDATGAYVCIHKVYGPRDYRGIVYTVNGAPYAVRVNCYQGGYGDTSIASVACWKYTNYLSDKPDPKAAEAKTTDPSQMKLLLTNGKPSNSNKISPEDIRQALPPEMK